MPLNFMKQGEGWYFIGSHVTGPMRAKVIGSFYQTHYADAVMKDLENESKKISTELKQVSSKVEELDERLIEFNYLDALEERLKLVNEEQANLTIALERYQKLRMLYLKQLELEELISRHEEALLQLEPVLEKLHDHYQVLRSSAQRFQRLRQLRDQLYTTQSELSYWEEKSETLKPIPTLYQALSDFQHTTSRFRQLYQLYHQSLAVQATLVHHESLIATAIPTEPLYLALNELKGMSNHFVQQYRILQFITQRLSQYRTLETLIHKSEQCLAQLPDLEQAYQAYREMQACQDKQVQLYQLYLKQQEVLQLGRQESAQVEQYQHLLTQEVETYRSILQQLKQCPVCLAEISNDTVNHIIAKHLHQSLK